MQRIDSSLRARSRCDGNCIITARKRSWGQGNIFTRIRHSVHGGLHAPQAHMPQGMHTPGTQLPPGMHAPQTYRSLWQILWDVVNELECIIVVVILIPLNVDVTNEYCGTKWRCLHGNGIYKTKNYPTKIVVACWQGTAINREFLREKRGPVTSSDNKMATKGYLRIEKLPIYIGRCVTKGNPFCLDIVE